MFFFPFFPSVSFPFSPPPVQPQAIAPGQAAPVPPRIKVCDGIRACVRWESNSVETVNTRAPWSTTEPTCPSSPRPQLMSGGPKQRPRSSKCRSASPVRGRHRLCGLPAQPHTHTHTRPSPHVASYQGMQTRRKLRKGLSRVASAPSPFSLEMLPKGGGRPFS